MARKWQTEIQVQVFFNFMLSALVTIAQASCDNTNTCHQSRTHYEHHSYFYFQLILVITLSDSKKHDSICLGVKNIEIRNSELPIATQIVMVDNF